MQTPIVATQISTNKDTLLDSPSGIHIFTGYKHGEKQQDKIPLYKNRGCTLSFVNMKFV